MIICKTKMESIPNSCMECDFLINYQCSVLNVYCNLFDCRRSDCPLIKDSDLLKQQGLSEEVMNEIRIFLLKENIKKLENNIKEEV